LLAAGLLAASVGCDASVKLDELESAPAVAVEEDSAEVALPPADEEPSEVGIDDFQKGKRLRESKYHVSRALAVRFTAEQKLFLVQKDHALDLYMGEHGYYPKTHEEFMESIIKFNKLSLPELEPGYEYLYKPEAPKSLFKQPVGAATQAEEESE